MKTCWSPFKSLLDWALLNTSQSKLPLFMHLQREQCWREGALQIPVKLFVCEALLDWKPYCKTYIIIWSWCMKRAKDLLQICLFKKSCVLVPTGSSSTQTYFVAYFVCEQNPVLGIHADQEDKLCCVTVEQITYICHIGNVNNVNKLRLCFHWVVW